MSAGALRVSAPVVVVSRGTTRRRALALMHDHGVRHLPLVAPAPDGADPVCVGLLVDRDLALSPDGDSPDDAVDPLARLDVPHVGAGEPPQVTARAVLRGGCDAALVVREGCLVGIVTATDVLRSLTGGTGEPA